MIGILKIAKKIAKVAGVGGERIGGVTNDPNTGIVTVEPWHKKRLLVVALLVAILVDQGVDAGIAQALAELVVSFVE